MNKAGKLIRVCEDGLSIYDIKLKPRQLEKLVDAITKEFSELDKAEIDGDHFWYNDDDSVNINYDAETKVIDIEAKGSNTLKYDKRIQKVFNDLDVWWELSR